MTGPHVDLWWLPVGAGGHVVIHTSRWWELLRARREHRHPRPLFHAALEAFDGDGRYVIEMTPAWGQPAGSRGVVANGPVGAQRLGRLRSFRYEVRCWEDGTIPDKDWAVGPPARFALTPDDARALLGRVATVPPLTWGRDVLDVGDMWNSNSLVSWLLHTSGIDASDLAPPHGGSAPGWRSGIAAAMLPAGRGDGPGKEPARRA
ncbi:hypothetical protein [Sanguibacter sp. 25GB23B1]|uniref:hypothetical protein n=1 Tax=unclassified Sanguibacter TaxID=2645534 RepID=UPI0032AFFCA6